MTKRKAQMTESSKVYRLMVELSCKVVFTQLKDHDRESEIKEWKMKMVVTSWNRSTIREIQLGVLNQHSSPTPQILQRPFLIEQH